MKKYKVVVYGSLKNGNRKIEHVRGLLKIAGWYPSIKLDEDGYRIEVEIAVINEVELVQWDVYEDLSGGLYKRTDTVTEEGTRVMIYEGAFSFLDCQIKCNTLGFHPKILHGVFSNLDVFSVYD